jgi:hypothetical protein
LSSFMSNLPKRSKIALARGKARRATFPLFLESLRRYPHCRMPPFDVLVHLPAG